jgi:hypothetical protein
MVFTKRFLHGMQLAIFRDAFNRHDICTIGLCGKHRTTLDRTAIDMNDASATLAGITANVGTGSAKTLANHLNQQRAGRYMGAHGFAIHRK